MSASAIPGLPPNVTSRIIAVNDLDMHILETSPSNESPSSKHPLIILLHGFPELSYSWRKVMAPLGKQGYAVVAPDQRGYGQTRSRHDGSKKIAYEDDLAPYTMLNLTTDIVALVYALGYTSVAAVVGHDFGSPVAAHCALIRPDIFKSVVLMSAPFGGPPELAPFSDPNAQSMTHQVNALLATFDPPLQHYTMYFSGPNADRDMTNPPEGLHTFLRKYFHVKSADWEENGSAGPLDLSTGIAGALRLLPKYYIMPLAQTMPECTSTIAPSQQEATQKSQWLTDAELDYYVAQFGERGFQGALNWYRCQTDALRWSRDLRMFAGKQIAVPAMFIGGKRDWGVWQIPGTAEAMRKKACAQMKEDDFVLVDGAGHWVQQEKPEEVVEHLIKFLKRV